MTTDPLAAVRAEVQNDRGALSVWGEGGFDARANRQQRMLAALTAVLDRHAPIDHPWGPGCLECNTAYYPCPTIHDINENLEDTP